MVLKMDYTKCVTEDGKNYAAIEKIIAELAMKDYLAMNPRLSNGRQKYKKHRQYILSDETNEAREIKSDYLSGKITEEEYKTWCLKYNLRK